MDRAGDDLFARAGLAKQEHGGGAPRYDRGPGHHGRQPCVTADEAFLALAEVPVDEEIRGQARCGGCRGP